MTVVSIQSTTEPRPSPRPRSKPDVSDCGRLRVAEFGYSRARWARGSRTIESMPLSAALSPIGSPPCRNRSQFSPIEPASTRTKHTLPSSPLWTIRGMAQSPRAGGLTSLRRFRQNREVRRGYPRAGAGHLLCVLRCVFWPAPCGAGDYPATPPPGDAAHRPSCALWNDRSCEQVAPSITLWQGSRLLSARACRSTNGRSDRHFQGCRSSVVEHPLGKGEVVSSILTGSTILLTGAH